VPYVPTPEEVVVEMLKMAGSLRTILSMISAAGMVVLSSQRQNYLALAASEWTMTQNLIRQSKENARKAGVTDRVKFIEQDLFETDIREATVVALYLLPELNLQLRPKLFRDLKPGSRIVAHEFDMGDWKPDNMAKVPKVKLYYHPRVPMKRILIFIIGSFLQMPKASGAGPFPLPPATETAPCVLFRNFRKFGARCKWGDKRLP